MNRIICDICGSEYPETSDRCPICSYARQGNEKVVAAAGETVRTKVKGGLTGYAQIYGRYNTSAYDKLRLDLMYIENYSLLMDIKLIILTLRIIFSKESTEGIDKQQENQRKIEELLREMEEK